MATSEPEEFQKGFVAFTTKYHTGEFCPLSSRLEGSVAISYLYVNHENKDLIRSLLLENSTAKDCRSY